MGLPGIGLGAPPPPMGLPGIGLGAPPPPPISNTIQNAPQPPPIDFSSTGNTPAPPMGFGEPENFNFGNDDLELDIGEMDEEMCMNDQSMMSMDQSQLIELTGSIMEQTKYTEDELGKLFILKILEEYRPKYRRYITARMMGGNMVEIQKDIQKAGLDWNIFDQICQL